MKYLAIVMLASTALLLSACETKKKVVVKDGQKIEVVQKKEKLSLESLDNRLSAVEARNAAVDTRIRANRAKAGNFTPAPKYDPNFK